MGGSSHATAKATHSIDAEETDRMPRLSRFRGCLDEWFERQADVSELLPHVGELGNKDRGARRHHGVLSGRVESTGRPITSSSKLSRSLRMQVQSADDGAA